MDLQKRVRPAKEEDSSELALSESEIGTESGSAAGSQSLSSAPGSHSEVEDDESSSAPSEADPHAALSSISFGALASAQQSLGPKREAPTSTDAPAHKRRRSASPFHEAAERAATATTYPVRPPARSSKHAPTEQTAKRAVTRRREVVDVPTVHARDPRFSALSGEVEPRRVERDYAFLNEYRQSEMAELRAEIRRTKDKRERERLERQLTGMEDRERARKRDEERRAVVREHRKCEREKVKAGKTPYFLKRGEVRRQAMERHLEGMGARRRAKAVERQRKREVGKEKKELPRVRRSAVQAGAEG